MTDSADPRPPQPRTPAQRLAADPARHVWVAASAGTGKTHVLTDRILRLLLDGSPPDRILALTFTKAAAAEMQNRLVRRLGDWLGFADSRLDAEFEAMGLSPTPARRARARALFAEALDVPGGLRVQTLHAFAQGLLAAFPLEAGLPPGFRALDDRDARRLKRQALAECIADAQAAHDSAFLDDLAFLSVLKGEGGVTQAIDAMIAHADSLLAHSADGLAAAARARLGVRDDMGPDAELHAALAPDPAREAPLLSFVSALESWGSDGALTTAAGLRSWLAGDAPARVAGFEELCDFLLTKSRNPRSFKTGDRKVPGLQQRADAAQDWLDGLLDIRRRHDTADLAARALRAGHRVVHRYQALKRARLAIDYDDMIDRTVSLLGPPGMPGYVGWKLDSRFDHLLVDEAQDTNDRQWKIIGKLIEGYFDGGDDRPRTLFVVGDHKQAIYGFQGTDPKVFERWRTSLAPAAAASGRAIASVDLDLSFRSGPAVLDLVNRFLAAAGPEALGMAESPPPHRPHRADAPGEVVLWPPVYPAGDEPDAADEAAADTGDDGPDSQLDDSSEAADRAMARWLAGRVAGWLAPLGPDRLWLPARGRWAEPGDILILLRKRSWLMGALVAELHQAGVPVAGVDRLLLTEPLAVLDCLALMRFAVQPEDDLTLATLLVSPFLGWNHEEVRALGGGRPGLWAALGRAAPAGGAAADARQWLGAVLALADTVGPARFLDLILSGPLEGRRRLVARLGVQANDPVDELVQQALAYELSNPPALAGFLAWVDAEGSEVKRDAEAAGGQVRLMTIHGAKGLEAPVVVLADAAHQRRRRADGYVALEVGGDRTIPIFHPRKADSPRIVRDRLDAIEAREAEEDLRLLYVGLTRAADHLFIGGSAPAKAREKLDSGARDCWHSRLAPLLADAPGVEHIPLDIGEALRLRAGQWTPEGPRMQVVQGAPSAHAVHGVLTGMAPPPPRPARPVTPSGIPEPPAEGPALDAMRAAARRGSWIHALFERLPAVPPAERRAQAESWLARQGAADAAPRIAAEVLAVLEDPAHAALFGPDALAEAPVAGLVGTRAIAGIVDRLLVTATDVLVVDFKTGLRVPPTAAEVPEGHRAQMAAYVAVLGRAFPGRRIRAALLYTAAPKFLLLDDKQLEDLPDA